MLKQFTEERRRSVWPLLLKLIPLIPLGIAIYVIHLDSRHMKQQYAQMLEEKEELLKCFDVYVQQSGYHKKKAGVQDIYVPSLRIRISNLTDQEFNNLMFIASFHHEGKSLCRAATSIMRLRPLETKEIYLRCIESAVFGSLISGLSLMDTTGDIEYEVTISHRGITVTAAEGPMEFSLFSP
jgi:hypothetical protein